MSDFYMGEIRMFPWDWPPKNWALCNGATMSIQQNQALFSLLGTTYGGNGTQTFNLPDLRGRVVAGVGTLPGGGTYIEGAPQGQETVTLVTSQLPPHSHTMLGTTAVANNVSPLNAYAAAAQTALVSPAPVQTYTTTTGHETPLAGDSLTSSGSGQAHPNMQPYLVVNYCIAQYGIFPSRN